MHHASCDVTVIGSGLAGLSAAIACSRSGLQVTVCSRSRPGIGSCSAISQGHFRSSVAGFSPGDHRELTLEAGQGLSRAQSLDLLVHRAEPVVRNLQAFGVPLQSRTRGFDTLPGKIGEEGVSITKPLVRYAQSTGVNFASPFFAWRIVNVDGRAAGVLGFHGPEAEPFLMQSGAVILATGGAGALYARTDNPQGMTGSGYGLAFHAGLSLMDMEFVQFYPLCLATSSRTSRLLPPVLAETSILTNAGLEDIVEKHAIARRPLAIAARDELCQAMIREVSRGKGHAGAIALRISHDEKVWQRAGQALGIRDLSPLRNWTGKLLAGRDSLPVLPAAHFCMGGVVTDARCQTALPGLLAAGEVVGGLHGANRYGGNALSEAAVFGTLAGEETVQTFAGLGARHHKTALQWSREQIQEQTAKKAGDGTWGTRQVRRRLQDLMWQETGVIRSRASLERALKGLQDLKAESAGPPSGGRGLISHLDLLDSILVAETIVRSAHFRRESRGAHFREDVPRPSPDWTGHVLISKNGLEFQPGSEPR